MTSLADLVPQDIRAGDIPEDLTPLEGSGGAILTAEVEKLRDNDDWVEVHNGTGGSGYLDKALEVLVRASLARSDESIKNVHFSQITEAEEVVVVQWPVYAEVDGVEHIIFRVNDHTALLNEEGWWVRASSPQQQDSFELQTAFWEQLTEVVGILDDSPELDADPETSDEETTEALGRLAVA